MSVYVYSITAFLNISAFMVHRFRNFLFYYALFITPVSCTCVYRSMYMHVWMCVSIFEFNALIINFNAAALPVKQKKIKSTWQGPYSVFTVPTHWEGSIWRVQNAIWIVMLIHRNYYNMHIQSKIINQSNVIYFWDGKAEFSLIISPGFSVTWSFRNHSNMLTWCSCAA